MRTKLVLGLWALTALTLLSGCLPIPCDTDGDCVGELGFCYFPGCDPSAGYCRDSGVYCGPEYNPMCGCDGVTYQNDCLALHAGASIACEGECPCPS